LSDRYSGNATGLRAALTNHITNVATHYQNKVYCWDVVNEAIIDDGFQPGVTPYKTNIWYPTVKDYVETAFRAASLADPNAMLFYNDYGADTINNKSDAIYAMIKSMRQAGVPIHGIGFQMHITLSGNGTRPSHRHTTTPDPKSLRANLQRFGGMYHYYTPCLFYRLHVRYFCRLSNNRSWFRNTYHRDGCFTGACNWY
jgi:hypothetical protein